MRIFAMTAASVLPLTLSPIVSRNLRASSGLDSVKRATIEMHISTRARGFSLKIDYGIFNICTTKRTHYKLYQVFNFGQAL